MRKILVIRFSSIGDIVLATPVLRCLKLQLGAELHVLCREAFRPVLAANPYIDVLHTIKKDPAGILPVLKAERFDFVADLQGNLRSWRMRRALGRPGAAFPKLNWEKWLEVRFKSGVLPGVHVVDRYFCAVHPLGVRYDGMGLDYFIPEEEELNPGVWVDGEGYAAMAIGAAHGTKRMPPEKLAEVCRALPMPVLLLGGPGDRSAGARIAAGSHAIDLSGQLSLNQSASLVRQARLVVSHDTGLMHIAAAFRKPLVTVWGNTIPAFGMTPFYPDGMERSCAAEVNGLPCRPCSKIGYAVCPKGHFRCMNDQNTEEIARKGVDLS